MDILTAVRHCFSADYAEAREKFRNSCRAYGVEPKAYVNPNRGPLGEELTTDAAWFGPKDAKKVLVTIAGTHGVEGFTGSGGQIDWLCSGGPLTLPEGVAALHIHAINPHGFAWLRRVTEEGVDLNRNHVDFSKPLPANAGYDELADALLPSELSGPVFEQAEAKIAAYKEKHGLWKFSEARGGGQYKHPTGFFFGGFGPTWSRQTTEKIVADFGVKNANLVCVIDYHTGLGPFGYGEPICNHPVDGVAVNRGKAWFGQSVTEPLLGTSSSTAKSGLSEFGWEFLLGEKVTFVALEYGTYTPEEGRRALREDHWLHAYTNVDWNDPETKRIKAQIRRQYYPDTPDWKEMVLYRSRQILRQAQDGLAAS